MDEGRQQRRPGQRVPGVAKATGDDGQGDLGASLGQAQQRKPPAGLAAEALGLGERLFSPVELTEATPDVADFGVGRRAVAQVPVVQFFAGPFGFADGLGQGAAPLQYAGPVDPADAREDRKRMLLRPCDGRLGPLGRPVEVAELLAGADQAAVHLARGVGQEAVFDGEEHRLVEVAEALRDLTPIDQDPAHRHGGPPLRAPESAGTGRGR